MGLGTTEILLILLGFVLLFGGKKLPDIARSLGKSLREFQNATRDIKEEIRNVSDTVVNDANEVKEEVKNSINKTDNNRVE